LLVSAAREGRHVVWLRANDPLRSADADEDADVLAQAGVDFEVIHGAPSAMGAAAGANSR
jgi:siroheme synthase